jgi:outer membrane protein OmpA-like peptidoglycan-associated protein
MAKACKKCDPHELCEECPEWIFTLADLIMCMMGLFVILWVMKPGQEIDKKGGGSEELNKVIGAIREAFGYVPDPNSEDPVDIQLLLAKLERMRLNGPGEKGKTRYEIKGAEGTDPEVTTIRVGRHSAVGGRLGFEKGECTLTRSAMSELDEIVLQIRGHRNVVMVKGHASLDDFVDAAGPEQKMDLSLRRAQAVADYLTTKGVSPDILRVQGCSTFEPVLQRAYTTQAQAMNRRVEVEVTATLVQELQDRPTRAPTTIGATNTSVPTSASGVRH